MSKLTDIAADIDAMTLDEMVFAATADDRPMAGGDYDSKRGWLGRLRISQSRLDKLIDFLLEHGKAERVQGHAMKSGGKRYACELIHSPTLAAKIKQ